MSLSSYFGGVLPSVANIKSVSVVKWNRSKYIAWLFKGVENVHGSFGKTTSALLDEFGKSEPNDSNCKLIEKYFKLANTHKCNPKQK